jgi:hypothetical protein
MSKKVKKIDAIIKQKCSLISGVFARKSARILRNFDTAIAFAEDAIDAANEEKENKLNSLANVAGGDDTSACSDVINEAVAAIKKRMAWEETLEILKELKAELEEEVVLEKEDE